MHVGSLHILRKVHSDLVRCISVVLPETQKPEKKSVFQFVHFPHETTFLNPWFHFPVSLSLDSVSLQ